jgi:hypothetical protein
MSYRNPQIIIDNSGEIWGKAIANFGKQVAGGIRDYAETKKRARQAEDKRINGIQKVYGKHEVADIKNVNKALGKIKNQELLASYQSTAKDGAYTGKGFTVWVDGEDGKREPLTVGSLEAQTQMEMNGGSLSKSKKEGYRKIISNYQNFLSNSVNHGAELAVGADILKNVNLADIGNKIDFFGTGGEETSSIFTAFANADMVLPGVESTKSSWRKEDGEKNLDMITVNSKIDTQGETYKTLVEAGLMHDSDGNLYPEFTVDSKDSRYINSSWVRDLDKWAKKGNLVVNVQQKSNSNDVLKMAGWVNEDDPKKNKGWLKNSVRTSRKEYKDGKVVGKRGTTEQHFDGNGLWNDKAYQDEIRAIASGILTLPLDQQQKYISNTLGWNNKITKESWANTPLHSIKDENGNITKTGKLDFLALQEWQDHMEEVTGADGHRKATADDVANYGRMEPPVKIMEGQEIFFTSDEDNRYTPTPEVEVTQEEKDAIKTQKEVKEELNKEVKSRENAITRVSTILDNPIKNAALVGMGDIFSIKDKTVKTSVPQFDKYGKPIEAKEVAFDLSNDKEFISYISHMVKARKGIKSSEVDVISKMLLNTKVPKGSSLYEIFKSGVDVDSKEANMSRFNNKHIKTKG